MDFEQIQDRLLMRLREIVHNGELTERGFARRAGISQPHIHKVLKGSRTLSPDKLDLVLKTLNCTLLDLCTSAELEEQIAKYLSTPESTAFLPVLDCQLGPGVAWMPGIRPGARGAVPSSALTAVREAVSAHLADDPEMDYSAAGLDLAVLDVGPRREPITLDAIYAVSRGADCVLRRIRRGCHGFYLVADSHRNEPARWELSRYPDRGQEPSILGRVAWLGREAVTPPRERLTRR